MGLFCLPPKAEENCSALELVETAEENIRLWKDNPDGDYLLTTFAVRLLEKAAKKVAEEKMHNARICGWFGAQRKTSPPTCAC